MFIQHVCNSVLIHYIIPMYFRKSQRCLHMNSKVSPSTLGTATHHAPTCPMLFHQILILLLYCFIHATGRGGTLAAVMESLVLAYKSLSVV